MRTLRTAEDWAGTASLRRVCHEDLERLILGVRREAVNWAVHVALETGGKDAWRAADAIRERAPLELER